MQSKAKVNTSLKTLELRNTWSRSLKNAVRSSVFFQYIDILLCNANADVRHRELVFMLGFFADAGTDSPILAHQLAKVLDIGNHASALFNDSRYQHRVAAVLTFYADSILIFDADERALIQSLLTKTTGLSIALNNDDLGQQVADIMLGKAWAELVYKDWNLHTKVEDKVALVLNAPLNPELAKPELTDIPKIPTDLMT